MKINFTKFLFLIFFLISCNNETKKQTNTYFSLVEFFNQETVRLIKQKKTLNKIIKNDEIIEQKIISEIDWNKELEIFKECDINKPAWKSLYHIENEQLGNETIVRFTALEDDLLIKNICIKKNIKNNVIEIQINKSTKNNLYSSEEELIYNIETGYSIKRNQKVFLLGNSKLYIKASFLL